MVILDTQYYFFTLPNTLDNHTYVHMVQRDTCLYDLQYLDPEELAERMRKKKDLVRRRKMRRIRERAEKLVWLKKELRLMHKRSWTESGTLGIIWWNWEYWELWYGTQKTTKIGEWVDS